MEMESIGTKLVGAHRRGNRVDPETFSQIVWENCPFNAEV
jgi:hypothetical protein